MAELRKPIQRMKGQSKWTPYIGQGMARAQQDRRKAAFFHKLCCRGIKHARWTETLC